MCFSTVHEPSFRMIKTKWLKEAQEYAPGVPFLLIGTKTDLRDPHNPAHITLEMGKTMAEEINAVAYLEISAKFHPESLKPVFERAIFAFFKYQMERQDKEEGRQEQDPIDPDLDERDEMKSHKKNCICM
eukprot:Phypoly_transcript_23095.p1 GENE.Phypoly_transcript_23095~~Phypoly_transcript_23095.p1  ORF type:complete len:130 (+),score=11.35 Phypoly_transcript_23095:108-497(+)